MWKTVGIAVGGVVGFDPLQNLRLVRPKLPRLLSNLIQNEIRSHFLCFCEIVTFLPYVWLSAVTAGIASDFNGNVS